MEKNDPKIQIATFYNEDDSNKFLATLLPEQIIDIKVFFESQKKCLSYTVVFQVESYSKYQKRK